MNDIGPVTSFEEDVKLLGIEHLFEDSNAAPPAGDKAKPAAPASAKKPAANDVEAAIAAAEQEVEQEEEVEETEEQETEETEEQEVAEDDCDDEGDEEGDEDEDGEDEEDGDEAEEQEETVEVDPEFEAMIESDEKLRVACDILGQFYEQLEEGEGESITRDTLVGVIEAYEYVTEQVGVLDEVRRFRIRGGKKKRLTRGAVKKKKAAAKSNRSGGVNRMKYTASGKKVRKTSDELRAERKATRFLKAGKSNKGGGAMRRARSMKKTARLASDEEQNGSPLAELLDNLKGLREAVTGSGDYRRQAEELKEGFSSIAETANAWMESIAEEVKKSVQEDESFDPENDPRVEVGRHLEDIAADAAKIIALLDEEKAEIEKAGADLEALAADLHDTAEVMKKID